MACLLLTRVFRTELRGLLINYPLLYSLHCFIKLSSKLISQSNGSGYIRIVHCFFPRLKISVHIIHTKIKTAAADRTIKSPPALPTRMRDGKEYLLLPEFMNTYHPLIKHPLLCAKTKENTFQTLNRTIWTNNKAFKSGMRDDPDCPH